jgi:RNA polymerase sigma-54 factor
MPGGKASTIALAQAIAGRLKDRGVTIARRTVVKYREQLGIPSARHRKSHGA